MTGVPADRWEGATAGDLAGAWGAPEVHLFSRVGSTNDEARRLAAAGAPTGTVVLAERQLAGRGRAGRGWESPAGLGLWLSLVIRPHELDAPGAVPLLVGLTVADALEPFVRPAPLLLKWPNDLLSGSRKLGGILCEAAWEEGRPSHLVAGVGLNLLHRAPDFPHGVRAIATSVAIASGRAPARLEVARAVVSALTATLRGPLDLTPSRLRRLEARDALRGRHVTVSEPTTGARLASGTVLGVSPDGALLLRTPAGVVRSVHTGTVRAAGDPIHDLAPAAVPPGDRRPATDDR